MSVKSRINPFRVGTEIRSPADFVGRKDILRTISSKMMALQSVSLHGERRTGKTSLLLYLAHPDTASVTELPPNHVPVYFNFQSLARATMENVWQAITEAISNQVEQRVQHGEAQSKRFLATIGESREFPAVLGDALAGLGRADLRIHLLFDEFEQTAENPHLGNPFYHALRSLPERSGNLSYVIATRTGLASLQLRLGDYTEISSPFFNIFTTSTLHPFWEDEVNQLVLDCLARTHIDFSLTEELLAELPFLYEVTGYHPFFVQMLCHHLFERLDYPDWPLGQARQEALRDFEQDSEPHFEFYWKVSSEQEQVVIERLATEQAIDWDVMGNVAQHLENRCMIVQAESGWRLFSSVFAKWVKERFLASLYSDAEAAESAGKRREAIRLYSRILSVDETYLDVIEKLDRFGIAAEAICPSLLENYQIERKLGEGSGGCVYLARHEGLGRYVALKHRKVLTSDDQHRAERLLQEARTVANLRHPNVAIVLATERYLESGDYCVVMEYADGGTLADLLKSESRLSLERAIDVGIEICTALAYVHRQGLIHGDIKPSNILFFRINDHFVSKIADFGLSQSVQEWNRRLESGPGRFSGTLEYAAPELLAGESVDQQVDLYSLGAVLYHMLTGKPPFPFSGDVAAVTAGHLHGCVTPPQELRPVIFDELNRLVLTALAKLPSERFQNARVMLPALQTVRALDIKYHEQAEKLYNRGIRLADQNQWSGAVQSFEEAYTLNPELKDVEQRLQNAQLQLELESTWREMESLLAQEAWADALEQLGRVARLDPEYRAGEATEKAEYALHQLEIAALYGNARAAEGAGRRREATRLYVDIVSQDDSYGDATQRLARLRTEEDLEKLWTQGERFIQKEKWEEAIKICVQMLDRDPDHLGAARQLAYARRKLELSQLYAQALDELREKSWAKAIRTLEDVTRLEPGYKDAAVLLARVSRRQQLARLRQSVKRAIEAHHWSEAEKLLEGLLNWEPGDTEAQQQREHVQQWKAFEDLYERGRADCKACQWDEAIVKLDRALKVAGTAGLDLHAYPDIRSLVDQAKMNKQLDALRKEAKEIESAGDFNAVIQVLNRMLELDPGNQKVLRWKDLGLQRMRLRNLYAQASSRMEQRDWAGAKRLLNEIASADAQFEDVQAMRAQVALGQVVNSGRRWGFPLAIALGVGLLVLFVPELVTEPQQRPGLIGLAITPEFVTTVVSVFALIGSIIGLLVPAKKLYGLLEGNKRLRTFAVLVVLLVSTCLLMSLIVAFVPRMQEPVLDPDNLRNGSFEERFDYWEIGGDLNKTVECEDGQCFAVLGDPDYACEGKVPVGQAWIKQSLKVPETVSPTLSLRYRVFSYDILSSHLDESDFFQVSIGERSIGEFGNTEWDKADCSREVWDSRWQSVEFDLSPYGGERVELSLRNVNKANEWWNTWTYVDDVEVH